MNLLLFNIAMASNGRSAGCSEGLCYIISVLRDLMESLVPVLFTIALIVFIWGIVRYVMAEGDPEKKRKGMNLILYGIVGLFVIFTIWGLIKVIADTFDIEIGGTISPPDIQF